jgi:nicotinate phosphoribosyltransferase
MNGLLTDLYELTMAAGYCRAGKAHEIATFELTVRRLPSRRGFLVAAGLAQVVDYLLNLRFNREEIAYLRKLPQLAHAPEDFFSMLESLRFTGDLFAVPEGTVLFAGEPLLTVRAPLVQAQIAETFLLSSVSYETLVATKAARVVEAAGGRGVVEFGTRRAHSPQAGVLAGRAAYIGGCAGTSNTLTGYEYGVPVYGTTAHSWIMSFADELEAFRRLQELLGPKTIYLVDSYDTIEGTRKAVSLGPPLWGVRLDSGDLVPLSHSVRSMLDTAGLHEAKIMVSGDLNEYRIRELVAASAPIDVFGVGTDLVTSSDAPNISAIYKMVEHQDAGVRRYTAKFSVEKISMPGAKQIFRYAGRDEIGRECECPTPQEDGPQALLAPVIVQGRVVNPLPTVEQARTRASEGIRQLPEGVRRLDDPDLYPVGYTPALTALAEQVKRARAATNKEDGE